MERSRLKAATTTFPSSHLQHPSRNCSSWRWQLGALLPAWCSSSSSSCPADGATRRDRSNCAGPTWRRLLGKRGKTRRHGKTRMEPEDRKRLWSLWNRWHSVLWEAGHDGTPGDGVGVCRSSPCQVPSTFTFCYRIGPHTLVRVGGNLWPGDLMGPAKLFSFAARSKFKNWY